MLGTILIYTHSFKPRFKEGSDLEFSHSSFEVMNNGNLEGLVIGDEDTLKIVEGKMYGTI